MKNCIKILLVAFVASAMLIGCGSKRRQPVVKPVIVKQVQIIEEEKVDKNVRVTGAAGELKKITIGGVEELVSKVSHDGRWLLLDTYTIENNKRTNFVIQKVNLSTLQKTILTPMNSSNSRAIWSKDGNKIIFNTNRTGAAIVESMGVDGESGVRFITTNSLGSAKDPSLSMTKDEIAFVLNGYISIVNLDGMEIRMFGEGNNPKFSNNGKKILFVRNDGNFHHLFLMNTDGASLIQLTNESANDFDAAWSPDNTKIAFISDRANDHKHLFVMDIDGKNLKQLTDGNFDVGSLDWSVDGNIYFSANAGGNRDIWRLRLK